MGEASTDERIGSNGNICLGVYGDFYLIWDMGIKLVNEIRVYRKVYVDKGVKVYRI